MTAEYALVPISTTEAARVPLPVGQTAAERDAYLAAVPVDVLDSAERWPYPAASPVAGIPDDDDPPTAGDED